MEYVPARRLCSKIDLTDRYHNNRVDTDSEKQSISLCHMGHYRRRIMQQGDCNVPATMVPAIKYIFREIINQGLTIYIDDIII